MINSGRMLSAGEPLDGNERTGSWSGAATAAAFAYAVRSGRLDLPLPGSGWTRERWAALADLAEEDLSLARLAEGHADAVAILAELGARPSTTGSRWGVWAAQPPGPGLIATRTGHGWRLDGTKQYCSGARSCTDALVTAAAPDGSRLFAVSTRDLSPVPGSWPATGMAASDTLDVEFTNISAQPVGEPGRYIDRPGFAHGGAGVAACWYGGARGVARTLLAAAAERDVGPHAKAHLGAVDIALHTARSALEPEGTLLAVHWRHPVADYPRSGDDVHQVLAECPGLARLVRHDEPDFLAEVYIRTEGTPVSVAEATGLV